MSAGGCGASQGWMLRPPFDECCGPVAELPGQRSATTPTLRLVDLVDRGAARRSGIAPARPGPRTPPPDPLGHSTDHHTHSGTRSTTRPTQVLHRPQTDSGTRPTTGR